jgi:hypothetical protein
MQVIKLNNKNAIKEK